MSEGEWENVKRRERYIRQEIDPVKLLRILELNTLTQIDCENIEAAYNNHGAIHATENELLTRLKKKGPLAFSRFVTALRETGQDHAAQLLDPKWKVTDAIPNAKRDDRVLEAGIAADIRIKICLLEPTQEQVNEVKTFCNRFEKSNSGETGDLRQHFKGFLSENVNKFVNFVKTTYDDKSALILIFRFSDVGAANEFWHVFTRGDLESVIKFKLQSFHSENNCFKDKDILFDIVIDKEDFTKVHNTLEDPKEYGEVLVDGMEKQELKLREYQLELAKPALEGRNSIICAPTGSGKTFVAMEVIKHIMAEPDHKFVVFIVNTVSLVEQQQSNLERYLPDSVSISSACGSYQDINLLSILESNNVVVLTAQLLLNALKNLVVDGQDSSEGVKISQFSLFVFDECHHTTKDHPYNEIMRWYLREKFEAETPVLPQIIGLSASLGIGTGNQGSGSKAEEHIMKLLANLDIHDLQVYTGNSRNICTNITAIPRDESNVFHRTIDDVMSNIETMMGQLKSSDRPTCQHGSQPYENWVVQLFSRELKRDNLSCAEHLKFYNNSLMMNNEVRTEDALQYLHESINLVASTEVEKKLREIFVNAVKLIEGDPSHTEPNPGLQKLESRLQEKLSCNDGRKSKGIIFVRTRDSATALVNWMKNSQALKDLVKNPTSVIGCGQRNGKTGMPKARQDKEIKSFRDGECNVIVATSVLLEGIDIPECNFAINYGMPGNEITFTQARGRVRSNDPDGWQYDIIVPHDQVMIKQRDLQKEKLMNETIKKVERDTRKENFREQVENRQKAYYEYFKSLSKAPSHVNLVPEDVTFHCIKCDVFACKARHIKKFNSAYIVPNYESNLHNATFEETSPKMMGGGLNRNGKTYCKDCNRDWGNRAKNEFGEFPLIKIQSFRVKNPSHSFVCKKWKDFPYDLETFNPDGDLTD